MELNEKKYGRVFCTLAAEFQGELSRIEAEHANLFTEHPLSHYYVLLYPPVLGFGFTKEGARVLPETVITQVMEVFESTFSEKNLGVY